MGRKRNRPVHAAALVLAASTVAPAWAGVKDGVDAWSRGDYARAVREWQAPADAGDPDAQFNLAQAYRLGRGVAQDAARAEALYARAAQGGHLQAGDIYGLMLFQDGRREAAMPYIRDAAGRGDSRAQYLLGIAHFNGDLMPRDWVRAYALVSLAQASGLPQAVSALARMDADIPLDQRQQAVSLAQSLRSEAETARNAARIQTELAVAPTVPAPQPTVAVSPSVAAARAAVAEASRATGTESPAEAGASYARPPVAVAAASPAPTPTPASRPAPAATPAPAPRPATVASASGPWKVQLGAFAVPGNAEKLWAQLSGRAELAGRQRLLLSSGRVTRLLADGYASKEAADAACRSLSRTGQACLVTRN